MKVIVLFVQKSSSLARTNMADSFCVSCIHPVSPSGSAYWRPTLSQSPKSKGRAPRNEINIHMQCLCNSRIGYIASHPEIQFRNVYVGGFCLNLEFWLCLWWSVMESERTSAYGVCIIILFLLLFLLLVVKTCTKSGSREQLKCSCSFINILDNDRLL